MRENIIQALPFLQSFLRDTNKSVVESVIEAFTQLIADTGKNISLHHQFHTQCDLDNVPASFSKYKQRRFATLGYSAGAILHHQKQLKDLLNKYHKNMLSQACRFYISHQFIIDSLATLATVTEKITLPFLVMVQKVDQFKLTQLLPLLHGQLQEHRADVLREFIEPFKLNLPQTNETQLTLSNAMLENIAKGLQLQRGREYGFAPEGLADRATNLVTIDPELLRKLPTHNLFCERDLAVWDRKVARNYGSYNKHSTLVGLRDEMTLHQAPLSSLQCSDLKILKRLDKLEKEWQEGQISKQLQKDAEAELEMDNEEERVQNLVCLCLSWGGPIDSIQELSEVEEAFQDELARKKIFKTEIQFRRRSSFIPGISYRVNNQTSDQLRATLVNILSKVRDFRFIFLNFVF